MPAIEPHPTAQELEAYALGTLDDAAQAELEGHIDRCPDCQRAAAAAPADPFVQLLRTARRGDTPSLAGSDTLLEPVVPAELLDHPRYQILRLLGTGGMGTVWLAEHKMMGRRVALKVIRPEFLARPGAVERFRREAHAAARLQHANIVAAYDAEQAGNTHFLVMEYVEGRTLAELLAEAPLPPHEACRIAIAVAHGIQHAHAHGIIHRDLKPANVLIGPIGPISPIGPLGTPKVADFGLATITADESGLTAANMVVGTPDYIAPEQAEDPRAADARSDVYALGCTLYEMLTGRVPFPGESVLRKLDAHRARKPEALPAGVSPALATVVAKMMAKRPADRYQTAAECAAALERYTHDRALARNRLRFSALKALTRKRVIVGVLFLASMAALAGVILRVQTGEGEVVVTVESPNAQVVLMQGAKEIQVIDTKTQKKVTVPIGEYDVKLKDSPEGLTVRTDKITVRRGKEALVTIERVAATAMGPRPIAVDDGWPPSTEGREIRSIVLPWWGRELGNPLSPDGKYVVFPSASPPGNLDRLRVEDVVSGREVYKCAFGGPLTWMNFGGDGKQLVFAVRAKEGHDVYVLDNPDGSDSPIHHFPGHDLRPVLLQLSDDAKLLAWSVQDARRTTRTGVDVLAGDRSRAFVLGDADKFGLTMQTRISPSGRFAATTMSWNDATNEGSAGQVRIKRLDGSEAARTFEFAGRVFNPFVTDEGRVGAVRYRFGKGYSIDWWQPDGTTSSQRVGAANSTAVYPNGRGTRVAVRMADDTIRVEDVGGWASARFVAGPFKNLKGCWLSADGNTMAVQTDTHLRLYRLPSIFGAEFQFWVGFGR